MTTENNASAQPSENALSDTAQMEAFRGMTTHDGEVVKPASDTPAPKRGSVPTIPARKADDQPAKGGESDDTGEDGGEDDEAGQKHKSAQARINKAVGRQRAAERRAAAAEQQLAAMNARLAALEGKSAPKGAAPSGDDVEPDPADFEHGELDSKYIRALARYETRMEMKAGQNTQRQQQNTQAQQAAQREFQKNLETFLTNGLDIADDFEEVVTDDSLRISPVLGDLAFESEHGTKIIYEMANDPKEAKLVSAMSPARQAAWFGRKEAELSSASSDAGDTEDDDASPKSKSPKATKAPEPLKGKARGSGQPQQVSADTPDFAAFESLAMKQE